MPVFRGISHPFRKGATAFPEPTGDDALIRGSLIQLILTGVGERVMRPAVGTNVRKFIFEPNTDLLSSLVQTEVSGAIARFEPRVSVLAINTQRIEADLIVTITYIVNATQQVSTVGVRL